MGIVLDPDLDRNTGSHGLKTESFIVGRNFALPKDYTPTMAVSKPGRGYGTPRDGAAVAATAAAVQAPD